MKLDIVSSLELSDAQMETVYGGGGAPLGLGLGAGLSSSQACETRIHSFAGFCDINVFSVNAISGTLKHLLNIANQNTQVCASHD